MSNNTQTCYNCSGEFSKLIFIKIPAEEGYVFVCKNCNSILKKHSGYRYHGVWQGKKSSDEEG